MTSSDAATARQTFVAAQVDGLGPLDFVLIGVPRPPFDAVQVLREEDGSLAVQLSIRDASTPYTPEQLTTLARLGFPAAAAAAVPAPAGAVPGREANGANGTPGGRPPAPVPLRAAVPPSDAAAAATLVDAVLGEVFGVDEATPVDVRHGSEREAREAAQRVQGMRSRIEPVLSAMGGGQPVVQDEDGDYVLDIGHVRVFVAPRALPGPPPPIIRVFTITNAGVPLTGELGMFLARLNFSLMFGRFSVDADHAAIWFDETLLGEHLTDEELRFTIEMVATTANEWDQKITAMFGGRSADVAAMARGAGDGPPANKPGQGGYL